MEVRLGYKRTELGVIPEDWEIKRVLDIATFGNGKAHEQDIDDLGEYIVVNSKFISTEGEVFKRSEKNRSPLAAGDIAMVMSDLPNGKALAKCFLVPEDKRYALNQRICRIRAVGANNIFLFFLLDRNKYFLQFDDGVNQTNLRKKDILTCPLPIPPTNTEQRAIATALSDVDALTAALDRLIAKKRAIKQGAMQQLLTGKTRLPGFSGEWEVKALGDVLDYEQPVKYLVKDTEYIDTGTPVLTAGKTFILGHTDEQEGIYTNLPVIVFDDFTTASRYVDFPFKIKSSAIKLLTAKSSDVDLRFVFERMQTIQFALGDHKRYYISEYQHIKTRVPPPHEQRAIATVLSDMDAEIAALEARRAKTRALKQGMMQELLTGRIRLVGE